MNLPKQDSLAAVYARQREPKDQKLRLAFIVVSKKINTRLFIGDRNPIPGTIVDDVITDPLKYVFIAAFVLKLQIVPY